MSFIYITDYIRSNITQICNLTGKITCNIIKLINIIYYLTNYEESRSICKVPLARGRAQVNAHPSLECLPKILRQGSAAPPPAALLPHAVLLPPAPRPACFMPPRSHLPAAMPRSRPTCCRGASPRTCIPPTSCSAATSCSTPPLQPPTRVPLAGGPCILLPERSTKSQKCQ